MLKKLIYNYKNMAIELLDDPAFTVGADNKDAYASYYYTNECQNAKGSFHGIRLFKDDLELNSCLLTGSGGTTIHPTSAIVDENSLLVCCGDSVFSLDLPSLELKWQAHADPVACFQIYKIEEEYLVHGEVEITRLNRYGDVIWAFSGRDIFVSSDNEPSFLLKKDRILLVDWEKNKYELGFNGKEA